MRTNIHKASPNPQRRKSRVDPCPPAGGGNTEAKVYPQAPRTNTWGRNENNGGCPRFGHRIFAGTTPIRIQIMYIQTEDP